MKEDSINDYDKRMINGNPAFASLAHNILHAGRLILQGNSVKFLAPWC
jgi:hypothetical protein